MRSTRRTFLAAVGSGIAITGGCVGSLTGGNELQPELDTVRSATEQYADPKKALQDGFEPGGPYVPGMGWHFTNPEWSKQAAENGFDLEKPPILTYVETDDGLQLGSAEFAAPEQALDGTPDLFSDENADATEEWHGHEAATHVFAIPDGTQNDPKQVSFDDWVTPDHWAEFSPPDESVEAGDEIALDWGTASGKEGDTSERVADLVTHHPTLKTLHVWVHADNPDGVFAPTNPEYGGGGHSH